MHWLVLLLPLTAAYEKTSTTTESSEQSTKSCENDELQDPGTDATFCGNITLTCGDCKYRSYDGSCNNLKHPWWGTAFSPYRRLVCNSNLGGIQPIFDNKLPNPRFMSERVFIDLEKNDDVWSLLFMQYGQIVAHDLSLTAGVAQTKKDAIACCTDDGQPKPVETRDRRCAPIEIPDDDPYNAPEGITCMDFIRVETTKDGRTCTNATDVPEPLSAVTACMDVSYLYGSDNENAKQVRKGKGGLLNYVVRKNKEFLPQDPDPALACNVQSNAEPCYYAGDVRVNQNPELALAHNVYMAHHNIIARKLAKLNPHWDDYTLFEETRRIVIAVHQWIVYNEFLSGLLGRNFTVEHKIFYPDATGYVNDYDPSVNPAVSNEFAACAFRLFHTEIVGKIKSLAESRSINNAYNLSDWFDKPSVCELGDNYNGFMRGLTDQPQSDVDRLVTNEVLNLLFKTGSVGLDLKAIDIQRGRDQGVCSCAKTLRAFKLLDPQCFKDYEKLFTPEIVAVMQRLFKSHEDIDLCFCIFLEKRLPGKLVGPIALHILADQFYKSRIGDRYFFENGQGDHPFTIPQLKAIRETSIAEIFCYNKDIKQMQAEAFKQPSKENPLKSCKHIKKLDLLPWKENIDKKD